jgi:hypothetical protein
MTDASGRVVADGSNGDGQVSIPGSNVMACSDRSQSQRISKSRSLKEWPARVVGDRTEVSQVSWMWLNIPLMVLVFAAVAGIPLWLVLTRPEFSEGPPGRPATMADAVAPECATERVATSPHQAATSPQPVDLAGHRELAGANRFT